MRNGILAILAALLLSSCGKDVETLKAELVARAAECCGGAAPPPLPLPLQPAQELRYEASGRPDPFYPGRR